MRTESPSGGRNSRLLAVALALCGAAASAASDGGVEEQPAGLKHLAGGTPYYWLLKDASGVRGVSTSGYGGPDAGPPTSTETGATTCASVRVTAGPSVDRLDLQSDGYFGAARFHATFALKEVKGTWRVLVASASDPHLGITLPASCALTFEVLEAAATDGGVGVATSAGPLFPTRAACDAVRKRYVYVCQGKQCGYAPESAPVFDLGACDAALGHARARLSELANASEAQRLATLQRTLTLFKQGGTWFERLESGEGCRVWAVKPEGELRARLASRLSTDDGLTDETRVLELRPLARVAVEYERTSQFTAHDGQGGGLGLSGRGGASSLPLFFGHQRVLVDGHWFVFSRKACDAAPR